MIIKCHPEHESQLHGPHVRGPRGLPAKLTAVLIAFSKSDFPPSTWDRSEPQEVICHHLRNTENVFSQETIGKKTTDFYNCGEKVYISKSHLKNALLDTSLC